MRIRTIVPVSALTAAAVKHDGAMVALIPTDEDAKRLALGDGEPANVLHMTMFYLGDAVDWNREAREALINRLSGYDGWDGNLQANAFGLAHWNPGGDSPCWVLNIGGEGITDINAAIGIQLAGLSGEIELPEIPEQHQPFAAHICLAYTDDTSQEIIDEMTTRLGEITFDRLRIAFADENYDIPLDRSVVSSAAIVAEFDPGQPRGEDGKWIDGIDGIDGIDDLPILDEDEYRAEFGEEIYSETVADGWSPRYFESGDGHLILDLPDNNFQKVASFESGEEMRLLAADISNILELSVEEYEDEDADEDGIVYTTNDYTSGLQISLYLTGDVRIGPQDGGYRDMSADDAYDLTVALRSVADEWDKDFESASSGTMTTGASATLHALEARMDWFIERNSKKCPKEWAVVRASDNAVESCHSARADALTAMRVLLQAQAQQRDETVIDAPAADQRAEFEGIAVIEGEWTGDGRQFAPGSLDWPKLTEVNVPLQWQKETSHGGMNDVTVNVGRVTQLIRDGKQIKVRGYVDAGHEDGKEVLRRMHPDVGTLNGVSIVADDPEQAEIELEYPEGCPDLDEMTPEDSEDIEFKCFMPKGIIFHSGRIRALTLVDTPAFIEASIRLVEDADQIASAATVTSLEFGTVNKRGTLGSTLGQPHEDSDNTLQFGTAAEAIDRLEPLLAAAYVITIPNLPPASWFQEPEEMPLFGAVTITEQGHIYGLIAPRDVAHRSYPDKRITVPMGNVDYSRWMNRETIVEDGARIRTGVITMDCGHASQDPALGAQGATEHYDNSCSAVATAVIGESKKHGVWFSGALLPGVTPGQVARILACQLSGDWRKHREKRGQREFVAALLVPVPGFAREAPGASLRMDQGELVASTVPVGWQIAGDVHSVVELDDETSSESAAETDNYAVTGATDLPVAKRDAKWDGAAAATRVFEMCTDGESVDTACIARAFLWRDPDANPETKNAYSLGFADVIDGQLRIVPAGVAATAGGRGVGAANIPEGDKDTIRARICTLYGHIREQYDDWPECPFSDKSVSSDTSDLNVTETAGSDIPSWEEVQRREAMRAQINNLAQELETNYGIKLGS